MENTNEIYCDGCFFKTISVQPLMSCIDVCTKTHKIITTKEKPEWCPLEEIIHGDDK